MFGVGGLGLIQVFVSGNARAPYAVPNFHRYEQLSTSALTKNFPIGGEGSVTPAPDQWGRSRRVVAGVIRCMP